MSHSQAIDYGILTFSINKKRIMIKRLFIAFLWAFPSLLMAGNNNDDTVSPRFIFCESAINYEFRQHGIEPISLRLSVGVKPADKLSVTFNYTPRLTLYSNEDGRTFLRTPDAIGGGIGYRVFQSNREKLIFNESSAIDVRAAINSTLSHNEIKFTSYEIGLYLYNSKKPAAISGLGLRHTSYHTPGMKNTYNVFIEYGFRF